MKNLILLVALLVILMGCAHQVVMCPNAPQDLILQCQSMSGQVNSRSSSSAAYYRGVAFGSGGATATRGVSDYEYMKCMKRLGYDCYLEDINMGSPGTTERHTNPTPTVSSSGSTSAVQTTARNRVGVRELSSADKAAQEYWSGRLGVNVKTNEKNTVVIGFTDITDATSRDCIKIGDEIIRVEKENINSANAYHVLTKATPIGRDDLATAVIQRGGDTILCRIKPSANK